MANTVLFLSSLAMAVAHLGGMLWFPQTNVLLTAVIVGGVATSIWNHGVTSTAAKLADRVMMWIGFFADLHLIWSIRDHERWQLALITLVAAAALYFITKGLIRWWYLRYHRSARVAHYTAATTAAVNVDIRKLKRDVNAIPCVGIADLPHLLAHLSLTIAHLVLLEAYAQLELLLLDP